MVYLNFVGNDNDNYGILFVPFSEVTEKELFTFIEEIKEKEGYSLEDIKEFLQSKREPFEELALIRIDF